LVPGAGVEPARDNPRDFKSLVSTGSTTRATFKLLYIKQIKPSYFMLASRFSSVNARGGTAHLWPPSSIEKINRTYLMGVEHLGTLRKYQPPTLSARTVLMVPINSDGSKGLVR
jgi:hypothetical protein